MERMRSWCMLRVCCYPDCGVIYGWKPGWGKTHGVCPDCYDRLMSEIDELSKRQKWGKK